MVRKRRATRAPFSPRSRRHVRQYVVRSAPRPASRRRLALRLTGRRHARCVGPTSAISLLRTSTRASLVLDASSACAPAQSRRSPVARQCDSLRRAARIPLQGSSHRGGRCLPVAMCAGLASDTPVASLTRPVTLARTPDSWEPPRPPSTRPRERANRTDDPGCLPSGEDLRPAMPFRASGSGLPRRRGLATTAAGCRHLCFPSEFLRKPWSLGSRPRAPLPREVTLL